MKSKKGMIFSKQNIYEKEVALLVGLYERGKHIFAWLFACLHE